MSLDLSALPTELDKLLTLPWLDPKTQDDVLVCLEVARDHYDRLWTECLEDGEEDDALEYGEQRDEIQDLIDRLKENR